MIDSELLLGFSKINVIGSPGSGKSTLAKKIGELLGISVYDLDFFFYDKKCKRLDKSTSENVIKDILKKKSFIIDGTYTTTFSKRLKSLDLVVLVDRCTVLNIYSFIKRLLTTSKLKCGERLTFKTASLILKFNFNKKQFLINASLKKNVKLAVYNRKKNKLEWLN